MPTFAIEGDDLVVTMTGWERVWALRRQVRTPLRSITSVRADPEYARRPPGIQLPGSRLPGIVVAGTQVGSDGRAFWFVRDPARAIVIELAGGPFRRLVVGVPNPAQAVRTLEDARRAA